MVFWIGKQLFCIFLNNEFFRKWEAPWVTDSTQVHISGPVSREESLAGYRLWTTGGRMLLDSRTLGVKARTMDHGPAYSKDCTLWHQCQFLGHLPDSVSMAVRVIIHQRTADMVTTMAGSLLTQQMAPFLVLPPWLKMPRAPKLDFTPAASPSVPPSSILFDDMHRGGIALPGPPEAQADLGSFPCRHLNSCMPGSSGTDWCVSLCNPCLIYKWAVQSFQEVRGHQAPGWCSLRVMNSVRREQSFTKEGGEICQASLGF